MQILSIETSTRTASIALMVGPDVIENRLLDSDLKTTQAITPAIRDALHRAGWTPHEVDLVAVSQGPGSFTGLRVGATTAKTFVYAAGCKLIGVDSLHVLAAQAAGDLAEGTEIEAVSDAGRAQLYAARFCLEKGGLLRQVISTRIIDISQWIGRFGPGTVVVGPVLKRLASQVPDSAAVAPELSWTPTAESIGKLGLQNLEINGPADLWSFTPDYLRRSAAEEKYDEKKRSSDA